MTSAPANEPTPHNPFIGKVMGGRYQVDRLIGRGGMGLVYLARELLSDRQLVLKMLAPHWAEEPSAVARFEREGKRLSELRHPNIVEQFDIGRDDDHPYIVMEFIRGVPLRKVLNRKGRLTAPEFFPIAAQLLEAVAYAHEQGVMLRDIKPSNVMLCERDGKANFVKVLDFGLAKLVDGDDVEVTKTNVIGTAGFLAPELIRGGEIDVRVDVYALSIMFFMMLTGSSPILGENDGAILYNHVHGKPRSFEEALPEGGEVPEGLQALVYSGMAKDPADRPRNAGAMLEALRGLVDAQALKLPPIVDDIREEVDRYWQRKFDGVGLSNDDPSSSLWTRPRLEKLLEGDADEAEAVEASSDDPYKLAAAEEVEEVAPAAPATPPKPPEAKPKVELELARDVGVPRPMPPQPSAAIRAKTRVGLPSVPSEGAEPAMPAPDARRPKPARTSTSSNMERPRPGPPPRRNTLPASAGSAGPREPEHKPAATPAPKDKPSVTLVPSPVEAPSPLDGKTEDVGPLHLELQVPTKRKTKAVLPETPPTPKPKPQPKPEKPKPVVRETKDRELPGSRATLPIGSLQVEDIELLEVVEELDIDVDIDEEPDPITDPVAPAGSRATTPAPRVMHAAEPAPEPKRGIGGLLVAAVAAALLLGGIVTWLALRDGSAPETTAAAAPPAEVAPKDDGEAPPKATPSAPAGEAALDEPSVDPDTPGTIVVEGPEGAKAFLNDESIGSVPAEVTRPPGLYTIRVTARGHEDWSTDVQLQPDGRAKLVAANEPKSAAGRARRKAGRPGGTKPASSEPKADPVSPKPEPAQPKPVEPKPEPPPKKPTPKEDDVFMKRGDKKDDGIFLPVGK